MKPKKSVILIGAGDRGMIYGKICQDGDSGFRVAGVVEPVRQRREEAMRLFGIPRENVFSDLEQLLEKGKIADAVFNCTMDAIHAQTSIPLLRAGYDLLLEKPIAANERDMRAIREAAMTCERKVMVCHVLRYAPFYRRIREVLAEGTVGTVTNIRMEEQLSYYHQSVSYVRGKYADPKICGSGILLSKCSHDLDIMAWLMAGNEPMRICSSGSNLRFRKENAPVGAAERCTDCRYEESCAFSAPRLYIEHPQRWANRVWNDLGLREASKEEKYRLLTREENPYGRCVYAVEPKIMDHQSVLITFMDGATGVFSMNGGAALPGREIHITGTKGEIFGRFEEEKLTLLAIDPGAAGGCRKEVLDLSNEQKGDVHGGGDQKILEDFYAMLSGTETSICCTSLEDSILGHEIVFAAEKSRTEREGGSVKLVDMR